MNPEIEEGANRKFIRVVTELTNANGILELLVNGGSFFNSMIEESTGGCTLNKIMSEGERLFSEILDELRVSWPNLITVKKSFLGYVTAVFLRGLETHHDTRLYKEYEHILDGEADHREGKFGKMITSSLLFHHTCLIEETMMLPMETMRLILSAKFPRFERIFYQFITPGVQPRFTKQSLAIMMLTTYAWPATATPLGVFLESHLRDQHSSYSKQRIIWHGKNMAVIGVLPWYHFTLSNGKVPPTLHRYRDDKVRCHFEAIMTEYPISVITQFLNHFDIAYVKKPLAHLGAVKSYMARIKMYKTLKKGQGPFRNNGRTDCGHPTAILSSTNRKRKWGETEEEKWGGFNDVHGIPVPIRITFLFKDSPVTRRGLMESVNHRQSISLCDNPANMLFLHSIVCSAIENEYGLLHSNTDIEILAHSEKFEGQFMGTGTTRGPVFLLLNNFFCPHEKD